MADYDEYGNPLKSGFDRHRFETPLTMREAAVSRPAPPPMSDADWAARGSRLNRASIKGLRNEAGPLAAENIGTGAGVYAIGAPVEPASAIQRAQTDISRPVAQPSYRGVEASQLQATPQFQSRSSAIQVPSPAAHIADPFLARYNTLMSKEGGTMGDAFVAAGALNRYKQLRPFDDVADKTALEAYEAAGRQQERTSAIRGREALISSPEAQARARLYGAQAGTAEEQLRSAQERSALEARLQSEPAGEGRDRLVQYYQTKFGSKEPSDVAQRRLEWEMQGSPVPETAMAKGGLVHGYADGGAVGRDLAQPIPQTNPLIAQYGQYLTAAASAGVPPVPFSQYQNLLQTTRDSAQGQPPVGFADGGDVSALGRTLEGPGTGTSDSIPAVIDGVTPAALSKDEFVFPAEVTKYYGTKFMNDLIAKAKAAMSGEGAVTNG